MLLSHIRCKWLSLVLLTLEIKEHTSTLFSHTRYYIVTAILWKLYFRDVEDETQNVGVPLTSHAKKA